MDKSATKIIIIDDELRSNAPLIVFLQQHFEKVELYKNASDGIKKIKNNLVEKTILILDMKLSGNEDGYSALTELRKLSYLIPVIIWTGIPKENSKFFDMINLKPYAIFDKTTTIREILEVVKKADADIEYSLSNALEKWIEEQPGNHDIPYLISTGGKEYSLNDMLGEVRKDTPQGREFTQDLVNLTIELMAKNHE